MTTPELRPVYAVAGRTVLCDPPVAALAPLRSHRRPDLAVRRRALALPSPVLPAFDGDARVGNRTCRVRSFATPEADFLQISGAGAFAVSRQEARIDFEPEPGAGEGPVAEALLGPVLALALARGGVFLLHASAVVLPDRGAIGFLGDSGAGKSTLARMLAASGGEAALAADDLLAVEGLEESAAALPHFPQLKLDPPAMAAIAGLEPRYPLLGLYTLEPAPAAAAVEAGEPLPPTGAAALLVRHTVAGALFAGDLLAAHFEFVADLAGRVPLRRLTVPRRLDIAAEVLRLLPDRI